MNHLSNKKILIAPLSWGLGHATRCVPVINKLLEKGFKPIIASDGDALKLLQKEFPKLKYYKLPAYKIKYSKNSKTFKLKLLFDLPRILCVVKKEQKVIARIIKKENIKGLISDNRFGVWHKKIPTVYITHQINVLSGIATFLTSKIHQNIIKKFDTCWVPDNENSNLSGKLSISPNSKLNIQYIGALSRFETIPQKITSKKYDILILLSGPEPQRTLLENKLLKTLENYPKKVLFVRGLVTRNTKEKYTNNKQITMVNYMSKDLLQKSITESHLVISRSGYSTIMDLEKLQAKAFFIPTPGQEEQEYLARYLQENKIAPYANQADFSLQLLESIHTFSGFNTTNTNHSKPLPLEVFDK